MITQTEQNLWRAFVYESLARNKYTHFAREAHRAGFMYLATFFQEVAHFERENARIWYHKIKELDRKHRRPISITESDAFEHSIMYNQMAEQAIFDNEIDLAELFLQIANAERLYENRLRTILTMKEYNKFIHKLGINLWTCVRCGHLSISTEAPYMCPLCNHPRAFFREA